jgi:hypothetical protein
MKAPRAKHIGAGREARAESSARHHRQLKPGETAGGSGHWLE